MPPMAAWCPLAVPFGKELAMWLKEEDDEDWDDDDDFDDDDDDLEDEDDDDEEWNADE